ncbi:MAG: cation diffusion facilitator family transporter [Candidatus Izemoplasmatales bacterium]|nr:cation diffusion facilitator family transporter [Candidatus Izemoplasmatales bacterium]
MKKQTNRLILPFVLNLVFTVFELVGGFFTNSIALISDSIHDLGDSISIGISLVLENKSKKKPDAFYTYGYQRFSLLGGLISSFILIVGSIVIIYETIPRLIHPELIDTSTLLWFSVIGVVVNLFAALRASKGTSINEKVIGLHLFEDALGWVALLVGAIIMYFFQIYWVDSVLSILFTIYILWHVFKNIKQITNIFLEKAPPEPTIRDITEKLTKVPYVKNCHHLHLWTLEGNKPLLTCHILLKKDISKEDFIEVQAKLHLALAEMGITHSTIEMEFECDDLECENDDLISIVHEHHH